MKNYIKPSIELTKFEVEDIMTISGTVVSYDTFKAEAKSAAIYEQYLDENNKTAAASVVEFLW